MARSRCSTYKTWRLVLAWSSSRDSAPRSVRRRRCPREAVTPRRLPGDLLLAQRVLPPGSQYGPLHHYEEVSRADETASLERTDDSTGAREDIEGDLRPEDGPVKGLAPQEGAGDQNGQEQERHDEAQELMARELKGEAAVTKRIQEVQIGHQNRDPPEKGPDLPARFSLSRYERDELAQRLGVRDRTIAVASGAEGSHEIARQNG